MSFLTGKEVKQSVLVRAPGGTHRQQTPGHNFYSTTFTRMCKSEVAFILILQFSSCLEKWE